MTSATRRPNLDQHGTEHRPGCHRPGWTSKPASLRGWHILTCPTCGAVRLVRAGRGTV